MKFLTGDDTGICKLVQIEAQKVERIGSQRRGDAIERLCWAGPEGTRETRVALAHASGVVELRDSAGAVLAEATFEPSVRRLQVLGTGLFGVSADGSAGIVAKWCDEGFEPSACSTDADDAGSADIRKLELPGPIGDAHLDPCTSGRLAFGGDDNALKVFDIERAEISWKSKNVRDTPLCLKVPNRISAVQWATQMAPSRSLVLSGSRDGKIRLYDASAQRKPLFELEIGYGVGMGTAGYTGTTDEVKRPVTASIAASTRGDSWSFFVGNTMGVLREYDMRKLPDAKTAPFAPGKQTHLKWASKQLPFKRGYRGIMGSIRSVDVHGNGDTVVCVGLGRFAYVFNTRKKRMSSKVYLKQKLCSVLLSSEEAGASKDDSDEEEDGNEGRQGEDGEGAGSQDEMQEGFSSDEGQDDAACDNDGDREAPPAASGVAGRRPKSKLRAKRGVARRRADSDAQADASANTAKGRALRKRRRRTHPKE